MGGHLVEMDFIDAIQSGAPLRPLTGTKLDIARAEGGVTVLYLSQIAVADSGVALGSMSKGLAQVAFYGNPLSTNNQSAIPADKFL
jgi:hypothetical protein